jgi:hypothetical protein
MLRFITMLLEHHRSTPAMEQEQIDKIRVYVGELEALNQTFLSERNNQRERPDHF